MAQQRPPNHVNPFYIEPSSSKTRDQSWNGDWRYGDVDLEDDVDYDPDYYYSDDDEYIEREDLLLNGNATNRDMGEYGRRRGRTRSGSGSGGSGGGHHRPLLSPRICVAASIVFMLFFVVLSSLGSGSSKTKSHRTDKPAVPPTNNNNNNNATSSSAIPQQQQPSSPSSSGGSPSSSSSNAKDKATTSEEDKEESEKKESKTTAETTTSSGGTTVDDGNDSSSSSNADQAKNKPSDQEKEEEEEQQQPTSANSKEEKEGKEADGTAEQKQFHVIVLGERHSGLDQLLSQVSNCFSTTGTSNNTTISTTTRIQSGYVRPGYWFQYNPTGVLSESKRKEQQLLAKNSTIVLYAIRHPITWFEAMRKQPIKMPNHYNYDKETSSSPQPLDWQSFLNKPLTMDRPPQDSTKKPSETCQLSFAYSEVLPCHPVSITQSPDGNNGINIEMIGNLSAKVDSDAVYELKKDGGGKSSQPYDNILQLRTDKIKHVMQQLPNDDDGWLKQSLLRKKSPSTTAGGGDSDKAKEKMALFVVNYEQQRTVASAIKKIQSITKWKRTCEINDIIGLDQEQEQQEGEKDNTTLSSSLITDDDEYIQAVSDLIDWNTENLVGYTEGSHPW